MKPRGKPQDAPNLTSDRRIGKDGSGKYNNLSRSPYYKKPADYRGKVPKRNIEIKTLVLFVNVMLSIFNFFTVILLLLTTGVIRGNP